jgi:hypothetical protein
MWNNIVQEVSMLRIICHGTTTATIFRLKSSITLIAARKARTGQLTQIYLNKNLNSPVIDDKIKKPLFRRSSGF